MERAEAHPSILLGSAGSLPAVFGSLPNTIFVGKLRRIAIGDPRRGLGDGARRRAFMLEGDRHGAPGGVPAGDQASLPPSR